MKRPVAETDGNAGPDVENNGSATVVSVPGKLILMGEHAVVYHRPALVGAVNVRMRVTVRDIQGSGVRLRLPQLGVREQVDWETIRVYSRTVRDRWREFSKRPCPENFRPVRGDDAAHVTKVALGEAATVCSEDPPRPIELGIESQIPIGAGFGSSAATGVGVVAAFMVHCGMHSDPQTIDRLALEVERRQHGLPSGVDHATVLRGGFTWARNDPSGAVFMEPVVPVSTLRSRIRVFDTGTPAESTGAVVAEVRDRLDRTRDRAEALLDRMEDATRALRRQLTQRREQPQEVVDIVRAYQACLVQLGVVPAPIGDLVRRIELEGGAAKISGAGALTGPGAGCLLVYHPDPETIESWEFLRPLASYDLTLGAEGLRGELPR